MKKAISLLVALATACSISVAAFAATDTPYARTTRSISLGTSEVTVGAHELYLVQTAGSGTVMGAENKLDPNKDYKFKIYYNDTNAAITLGRTNVTGGTVLTGAILNGGTVRLRTVKGSSYISSAKIKTIGSGATATYEFQISTREYLGTKLNDVEYSLSVTGSKADSAVINESNHTFTVGYEELPDEDTNVGEGGTITISNDRPVILKEQFSDIAKSANYKNIIFEADDGNWTFEGKVAGMKDTNFAFNYDPSTDLLNKFPDQEFKFLNFKSGVTFPTNGEMRIDVSDVSDTFGTGMHVYLYRNGRMTEVNSTHDIGADQVVFRTNYLGSFVITDKKITDTSIVGEPSEVPPTEEPPTSNGNNNPHTGASSAMNIALALGLATIVSAGAISRKK